MHLDSSSNVKLRVELLIWSIEWYLLEKWCISFGITPPISMFLPYMNIFILIVANIPQISKTIKYFHIYFGIVLWDRMQNGMCS